MTEPPRDPAKSEKATQETPKGKEIPVPEREDVMRDLKKIAEASSTSADQR